MKNNIEKNKKLSESDIEKIKGHLKNEKNSIIEDISIELINLEDKRKKDKTLNNEDMFRVMLLEKILEHDVLNRPFYNIKNIYKSILDMEVIKYLIKNF